jgi:putative copper export protein
MSQKEIIKVIIAALGFTAFGWSWLYVMGAAALFLVIMAIKKKLKRSA